MSRTIYFESRPKIIATSGVAGPKECAGCLKDYIQTKLNSDVYGEKSFEKAESRMLFTAIKNSIANAGISESEIDAIVAGDLLNQIISSTFAARNFSAGYLGVYNACATFTEALTFGAMLIDGKYLRNVVCATSSHFSSAERQYRYPLEQGTTRPPQSQWTVTGAGACVIGKGGDGVKIVNATIGKVIDYGVTDVNNMGAAMAPACADTLIRHFKDTSTLPEDYDLILSGDLGALGSRLLKDLCEEKGYDISVNHVDCGEIVYKVIEDEFQGGSGAGCSAVVFNSYILSKLKDKLFKRVLFAATGALLSTTSSGQGESIPCISHAVELRS